MNDENLSLDKLVNTSNISNEEINRWFSFKESYSMELVDYVLQNYAKPGYNTIMDPFMGAGTTVLKSFMLGKNAIGFDVNPIGILSSNVKTRSYNKEDISELKDVISLINDIKIENFDYPNWAPMERYISKDTLNVLMSIKTFIKNERFSEKLQDLLKLLWLSIIEEVSDFKKDGNGIKYHEKNIDPCKISEIYIEKIIIVIDDIESNIESYINQSKINIIYDSSMNFSRYVDSIDPIDAIITSPPYANCFDYFEVYKVELWMGGFISSQEDWTKLKKVALRSNMNADLSKTDILESKLFLKLIDIINEKVSSGEIKNKRIPTMLHNYFFDLQTLLDSVRVKLNKDAIVSIIVGNSAYGGKLVPTDEIIIDIAKKLNYKLVDHIIARPLRTSPQQMKLIADNERYLLRESIIILKY